MFIETHLKTLPWVHGKITTEVINVDGLHVSMTGDRLTAHGLNRHFWAT